MNEIVILTEKTLISAGKGRECHVHPHNKRECIKIPFNSGGLKDCKREVKYFNQVKKRLGCSDYHSRFLYTVETDRGLGYVYDLIVDQPTGTVSNTLEKVYVESLFLNKGISKEELDSAVSDLVKRLQEDKIQAFDLNAKNIVVQLLGGGDFKLVIVDGMGRPSYIPLLDWLGFVSRKRIRKYHHRRVGLILRSFNNAYRHVKNSED